MLTPVSHAAPDTTPAAYPGRGSDSQMTVVASELALVGDGDGLPVHPAPEVLLHRSSGGPHPVLRVSDDRLRQAGILHVPVGAPQIELGEASWMEGPDLEDGLAFRTEPERLGDVGKRADEANALDADPLQPGQHRIALAS